jgi:hypothetical protein
MTGNVSSPTLQAESVGKCNTHWQPPIGSQIALDPGQPPLYVDTYRPHP